MTWLRNLSPPCNTHGLCCHHGSTSNGHTDAAHVATFHDTCQFTRRCSLTVLLHSVYGLWFKADISAGIANSILQTERTPDNGKTVKTNPQCATTVAFNAKSYNSKRSDLNQGDLRRITAHFNHTRIEDELRALETLGQFKQAAKYLGYLCDFQAWRNDARPDSCDYDVLQLQRRIKEIERARCRHDEERMLHVLRTQLSRFVGGIDKETLFHPFLLGSKVVIEEYIDAVCALIHDFVGLCLLDENHSKRLRFAKLLDEVRSSFGSTAGLFSGGGTLGMRHVGTVKALFESGNLPRVITGSSAGSIVCAVLCSKTDDNLQRVLENFCHGDLKVFIGDDEPSGWLPRLAYFWSNGHLFDSKNLERVMKYHLGDVTFVEAYQRTGRILNIAVSTGNPEEPRILNYVNTPHVTLWSAVVASCALPFTYKRCAIHIKNPRTGQVEPDHDGLMYADGSVENDIPFDAIRGQFNINHSVVAQVNPHVVTFLEDKSAAEKLRKPTYAIFLDVVKETAVTWLGESQLASIIGQQYTGHITILPRDWIRDVRNVLRNPTPEFMDDARRKGERATWERLSIIENHMKIEKALDIAAETMLNAIRNDL